MRRFVSPLAVAAFFLAAEGRPSEPTDALWTKAVAIAAASDGWRPARSISRTEDLAKDGKVRHLDEQTGAPLSLRERPEPLPRFTSRLWVAVSRAPSPAAQ